MKNLKSIFKVIIAFFPLLIQAQQHDLKVNISNIFIYEANINYEYLLSDYVTIGGLGGIVYDLPEAENPNKYWYVGPEFRYYVNPSTIYGADRFFIGIYSRFKSGNSFVSFNEDGINASTNSWQYYYQEKNVDYNKLAIGFSLGGKWVTKTGFLFGVFGGIGRNLFSNYDEYAFENHSAEFEPGSYNSYYSNAGNDSKYWDFRIGFNVGWRFGK